MWEVGSSVRAERGYEIVAEWVMQTHPRTQTQARMGHGVSGGGGACRTQLTHVCPHSDRTVRRAFDSIQKLEQ